MGEGFSEAKKKYRRLLRLLALQARDGKKKIKKMVFRKNRLRYSNRLSWFRPVKELS
jgi:hypothetical protein